jgi:hypothetical protein
MTQNESEDFMREVVFVAFPAARQFVLLNSSNPKGTVEQQAKALLSVSFQEAMSVVDRWVRGELPAPSGKEVESISLHLRATVMQDRAVLARSKPLGEIREKGPGWKSNEDIAPYYARILKVTEQLREGTIDLDTFRAMHKQIVAEHQSAYEARQKSRTVPSAPALSQEFPSTSNGVSA